MYHCHWTGMLFKVFYNFVFMQFYVHMISFCYYFFVYVCLSVYFFIFYYILLKVDCLLLFPPSFFSRKFCICINFGRYFGFFENDLIFIRILSVKTPNDWINRDENQRNKEKQRRKTTKPSNLIECIREEKNNDQETKAVYSYKHRTEWIRANREMTYKIVRQ